jgi:hypothetical protein
VSDVVRSGVMSGVAGELQAAELGVRVECTSLTLDMRTGRGEVVVELGLRVVSLVLGVVFVNSAPVADLNVCKVSH